VTFNIVWKLVRGNGNPSSERPTVLEVESARGMIARFDAIEQLAAGSMAARREAALLGQRLIARKVKKRFDGLERPTSGRHRPVEEHRWTFPQN
jgi:hypothetical protein